MKADTGLLLKRQDHITVIITAMVFFYQKGEHV